MNNSPLMIRTMNQTTATAGEHGMCGVSVDEVFFSQIRVVLVAKGGIAA